MKKLLIILALALTPIAARSEVKDTTRFQLKIELSIGERLVQSLATGDFTVLRPKLHHHVILITDIDDTLTRYVVPADEMIDLLTGVVSRISGQAEIYQRPDDYLVVIKSEELEKPMLLAFGVDESGMIYKILIE